MIGQYTYFWISVCRYQVDIKIDIEWLWWMNTASSAIYTLMSQGAASAPRTDDQRVETDREALQIKESVRHQSRRKSIRFSQMESISTESLSRWHSNRQNTRRQQSKQCREREAVADAHEYTPEISRAAHASKYIYNWQVRNCCYYVQKHSLSIFFWSRTKPWRSKIEHASRNVW